MKDFKLKYPFEHYLSEIHAKQYTGTDDEMPDDYIDWLSQLDIEDIIGYGNQAINMILNINKK